MLHLSCLLLAVTMLEAHRTSYAHIRPEKYANSGAVYPIDYNDELTIKNPLVHPDANIIFSFSQTRRDQPPQLDNREERLGKYMYRHRKSSTTTTTTTSTAPPPPETTTESESESDESAETVEIMLEPVDNQSPQPEIVPEEVKPKPILTQPAHQHSERVPKEPKVEPILRQPARQNPESEPVEVKREPIYTARRHHQRAATRPIMLPTGLTTKQPIYSFHDFDSDLEVPDSTRIDPAARYPPIDIWQPRAKTTLPPFFTQTTNTIDLMHLVLPQATEETPKAQNTLHRRHKSRHGSKGDDRWPVTSSPVVPTVPAVVPTSLSKLGNPPPPVPTLTPWYGDEFGK